MIKGGYIIQPRKIKDSAVSKMPPCSREVWQYILREAFFVTKGNINRGQLYTRIDTIREDLKWLVGYRKEMYTRRQIEGAFESLRKEAMIVTLKVTHGIVITVCKYDYYQNLKNYEGGTESNNEDITKVQRRESTRGNIKKEGIKNYNTIVKQEEKNLKFKPNETASEYFNTTNPQRTSIWDNGIIKPNDKL